MTRRSYSMSLISGERRYVLLHLYDLRLRTRQTQDVACLAGITRSASSQPASRTVLSRKTTFLQSCAFVQERLQPFFPHMAACIVCSYLPALRLSWPTVTLVPGIGLVGVKNAFEKLKRSMLEAP